MFTKGGICSDEITLIFDDGQELYVSQNFLRYVSPVFRAMFEHEFEERKTRTVKLPGKMYADFLEFLLCLHPDTQKPVDNTNVLRICAIAEEYQSALIIKKCKDVMVFMLFSHSSSTSPKSMASASRTCLQILIEADSLQYEDIVTKAVSSIIRFGYKYFSGQPRPSSPKYSLPASKETESILLDCRALYDSLRKSLKIRLMSERLNRCDESDFHQSSSLNSSPPYTGSFLGSKFLTGGSIGRNPPF